MSSGAVLGQHRHFKKKKCGPLWLGISNSLPENKYSEQGRMLLSIVPSGVDIQDVLSPIVDEIKALNAMQFRLINREQPVTFHCTVSLIIGDSPASNAIIGMVNKLIKILSK